MCSDVYDRHKTLFSKCAIEPEAIVVISSTESNQVIITIHQHGNSAFEQQTLNSQFFGVSLTGVQL